MADRPETEDSDLDAKPDTGRGNLFTLEVCFLAFVGIVVLAAFFEALTYAIVSSRTPFVIMVPLLVLIAIHASRLWRARGEFNFSDRLSDAVSGRTPGLNKAIGISIWMIAMVLMILVLGHIAGIFVFCVILMRFLAGESWKLTLLTSLGTVAFVYGVFEFLFDIDLYRGLIIRYFLGFRDF